MATVWSCSGLWRTVADIHKASLLLPGLWCGVLAVLLTLGSDLAPTNHDTHILWSPPALLLDLSWITGSGTPFTLLPGCSTLSCLSLLFSSMCDLQGYAKTSLLGFFPQSLLIHGPRAKLLQCYLKSKLFYKTHCPLELCLGKCYWKSLKHNECLYHTPCKAWPREGPDFSTSYLILIKYPVLFSLNLLLLLTGKSSFPFWIER